MSPGAALRRAEQLGRLAAARGRIAAAARAAERADDAPPGDAPPGDAPPGEWSAHQVVLHLVAVEAEVFQARLNDLETQAQPHWTWVEPGTADAPETETLDEAIARFWACRDVTLRRVAELDEAGWSRSGTHETFGLLDVAGLLRVAHDHDLEHLGALERMAGIATTEAAGGDR
ncbi:MAG: DinB superfamily [Chloroflexota bacterium]|nr:DinB superfamily [Chloroflexota bacterium]